MNDEKPVTITVNPEKQFIVARTNVSKVVLCGRQKLFSHTAAEAKIETRSKTRLYWLSPVRSLSGEPGFSLEPIGSGDGIAYTAYEEFSEKEKQLPAFVDLFWIRDDGYGISVPWGLGFVDAGYHGEMAFKLTSVDKFLFNFDSPVWERETREGRVYEYLSEYFIDGDGVQRGLSIELRNRLAPTLEEYLQKPVQGDLKERLQEVHGEEFARCGLELISVTCKKYDRNGGDGK